MARQKTSAVKDLLQDLHDIGEDFSQYPEHLRPDDRPPPRARAPFTSSEQDIIATLKSYVEIYQGDLAISKAALAKPIKDIFTSGDDRKANALQHKLYEVILRYSRTLSWSDVEAQNRLVDIVAGFRSRPEPRWEIRSPAFIENSRSLLAGISNTLDAVREENGTSHRRLGVIALPRRRKRQNGRI